MNSVIGHAQLLLTSARSLSSSGSLLGFASLLLICTNFVELLLVEVESLAVVYDRLLSLMLRSALGKQFHPRVLLWGVSARLDVEDQLIQLFLCSGAPISVKRVRDEESIRVIAVFLVEVAWGDFAVHDSTCIGPTWQRDAFR